MNARNESEKGADQKTQDLENANKNLQFLSKTAMEFSCFPSNQNIYEFIGRKIRVLTGDSIVIVNSFDEKSQSTSTRVIEGLGKYVKIVSDILRINPIGNSFKISDEAVHALAGGILHKIPGGIQDLSPQVPKIVWDTLQKMLGVKECYSMGLVKDSKLFGSIIIITRANSALTDFDVATAFINQASTALQRIQAEAALKDYGDHLEDLVKKRTDELNKSNQELKKEIAERKQMEDRLRKSEEMFAKIFHAVSDPIALTVLESGKIIEVNEGFERISGYSRSEVVGRSILEVGFDPEERQRFISLIREHNRIHEAEFKIKTKNGDDLTILTSAEVAEINGTFHAITIAHNITESKRLVQALRESENRFREIIERAPIPMAIISMDDVIEIVNHKATEVFGYSREDIPTLDTWWIKAYPDVDYRKELVSAWMGLVQKALTEGSEIEGGEYQVTCKDGAVKTVITSGVPISDKILAIFNDITERRKAEEALIKTEDKFRNIAELLPAMIYEMDMNGIMTYANKHGLKRTGYSQEDFNKGLSSINFIVSEERPKVLENLKALSKGASSGSHEYLAITKDGKTFPVIAKSTAIFNGNKPIGFRGVLFDITDRKQAEEILQQSNEKFSTIFKTSPESISITRLSDGIYLEVNQAFTDTTGFTPEEILGRSSISTAGGGAAIWTTQEDRERLIKELKKNGEVLGMEVPLCMKNGTIRTAQLSCRIIEINHEKRILTIARDVTERNRMEDELQKMQKLESIGVLAGGIAHDFNNLLGGIFGYIEMAIDKVKDEKVAYYLSKVMGTIDRARGITAQLLTFAKGGAPVQKITPITPFIQETVKLALSGSDIQCSFEIAGDLWMCNIDKNQIGQVIENIVINARQAMPDGGVIEIKAENISSSKKEQSTLAAGNYVKISIKDSGIGISKDILSRIFDPFFTTKPKGRGLGLSVCHSVISRHEGAIKVESKPGKGSTFHIFLPASPESVIAKGVTAADHKGCGTIIFMDDEKEMQETVSNMLETFGYSVVCKNDGSEAVKFFIEETKAKRKIIALLFDLIVPGGMGGKKAVEEIRKFNMKVPVFVSSGYSNDPVMKNPAEYGFTASISKPFKKSELAEMLNKYLPSC